MRLDSRSRKWIVGIALGVDTPRGVVECAIPDGERDTMEETVWKVRLGRTVKITDWTTIMGTHVSDIWTPKRDQVAFFLGSHNGGLPCISSGADEAAVAPDVADEVVGLSKCH